MATASIRAHVPERIKIVKRRVVRIAKRTADKVVLGGVARPWLSVGHPSAVTQRSRPHYLIVRYGNYGPDPSYGDSSEAVLLERPLAATGRCTYEQFFWDRDFHGFPRGDWALLDRCSRARPDAILLSSYDPTNPAQARVETIRILRQSWNIPIVAFWWDTCWNGFWPSIQPILRFVDVHVVGDNPLLTFVEGPAGRVDRRRFVALWSSFDPELYVNPHRPRDIDVSFLGQVAGYRSERLPYLEHLQAENVPLFTSLLNRADQPPLAKYVEFLQRSKIGLNFSHSADSHQLKGRVFETMLCGALLMENENPQTRCYFAPMKDFVTFTTPADLADKIRYYLAHDEERAEIAARGEGRTRALYNHEIYWTRIFDALEASQTWPL